MNTVSKHFKLREPFIITGLNNICKKEMKEMLQ